MHPFIQNTVFPVLGVGAAVVTKKPKEMKTAWIYGRVNQASLKLYAGFPNTVCWTSNFFFANCLICLKVKREMDSVHILFSYQTLYQSVQFFPAIVSFTTILSQTTFK